MGSVASSMATFRRCIKNFDKVPDVYNYYGELLLDQQKYQEAIEKFETAVEMEKQAKPMGMNVLPLINKALALFQWKQDYEEAEKLCQKALISEVSSLAPLTGLLTTQQLILNAISRSQPWPSFCCSRARLQMHSGTLNVPRSFRGPRGRLLMPCRMPKRHGRNLKCRKGIHNYPSASSRWARADWADQRCGKRCTLWHFLRERQFSSHRSEHEKIVRFIMPFSSLVYLIWLARCDWMLLCSHVIREVYSTIR